MTHCSNTDDSSGACFLLGHTHEHDFLSSKHKSERKSGILHTSIAITVICKETKLLSASQTHRTHTHTEHTHTVHKHAMKARPLLLVALLTLVLHSSGDGSPQDTENDSRHIFGHTFGRGVGLPLFKTTPHPVHNRTVQLLADTQRYSAACAAARDAVAFFMHPGQEPLGSSIRPAGSYQNPSARANQTKPQANLLVFFCVCLPV